MRSQYVSCSPGSLRLYRTEINHLLPCFIICLAEGLCNLHFRMFSPFNLLLNNLFLHYAALFVEKNTYTSVS